MFQPLYCALAVYQIPLSSVNPRAYFKSSLSRSFAFTAIPDKKGVMSSAFHRDCTKNKSLKRAAGSNDSSDTGKYVKDGLDKSKSLYLVR